MEQILIKSIINILRGRCIFLVGMMASGKSVTGPNLAQKLGYKFIDMDSTIEKVAQKSINDIFAEDGEKLFREIETKCLKEVIHYPNLVISTGGGVVLESENWGILRQGIVVWINLDKDIGLKRLSSEIEKRPLLQGDNFTEKYFEILNSRIKLYSQADIEVKVKNENVDDVVQKIFIELKKRII